MIIVINEVLRSVTQSESEAEEIINNAREEATRIKRSSKEDIAQKKIMEETAFNEDASKKKDAVRAQEEEKDKEYILKVQEELDSIVSEALKDESKIVSHLIEQIYAI